MIAYLPGCYFISVVGILLEKVDHRKANAFHSTPTHGYAGGLPGD
jgi:hypothetical protein